MRRSTVHESHTRLNQAKFLLVLLVLKFTKTKDFRHLHHTN